MRFARILILAALAAAPAHAFQAQNGLDAAQISPTEIAVAARVRAEATDYWCAAGEYAVRVMGLPNRTRLYLASASPKKAGQDVIFTLDPAQAAPGSGFRNFGSGPQDGSVSLGHATGNFCRPFLPIWWD